MDEPMTEISQALAGALEPQATAEMVAFIDSARRNGFGHVSIGFKNGRADRVGIEMTKKLRHNGDEQADWADIAGYLDLARRNGWGEVRVVFKNGRPDEVGVSLERKVGK